ncbi:MAG: S-adenosylhomocysteine deaminase, partial [Thermodesulfovibrionales bacterium]|nr:S-adenosylhomocysteine deaminase [Thermodesulfovibrionales bacterium]
MQTADYIIHADYVITMDNDLPVLRNGALAIQGNKIADIGSSDDISKKYSSKNIIKGENTAVLPGLINTHTHAAMVYF